MIKRLNKPVCSLIHVLYLFQPLYPLNFSFSELCEKKGILLKVFFGE